MKQFTLLLLLALVPFSSAQVLFESDWSTGVGVRSSTSGSCAANREICDMDQARPWSGIGGPNDPAGMAVIPSTALDFPTANVLRVSWGLWSFLRLGQPSGTGLPIPTIGESRYYRWYFRIVQPDFTSDTNTHPWQDGNAISNSNWAFNIYNNVGPGVYRIGVQMLNQPYPYYSWLGPTLSKNTTYRAEVHVNRTGSTTYAFRVRVYDSANTLLYDEGDFTNDAGMTLATYITSNSFVFNNVEYLDGFNAGSNDGGPEGGTHSYQGAVCIRNDTWCGAYGAPALPPSGICEATGSGVCRYVDPVNGNDANPGTFAAPLRTPQLAVLAAAPSDVIYLRGGTYDSSHAYPMRANSFGDPGAGMQYAMLSIGNRGLPPWASVPSYNAPSGTAINPITVKSYPGERAFFQGYGISVYEESYWIVEGITVNDSNIEINGPGFGGNGVATHHITVRGNEVMNYAALGGGNPGSIKVDTAPDMSGSMNQLGAYDITIEDNIVHDMYAIGCDTAQVLQLPGCNEAGPGGFAGRKTWDTVEDNEHVSAITILNCHDAEFSCGTGRVIIRNNTVYNVPSAFYFKHPGPGPILIEGNRFHTMQTLGIWTIANTHFENNIVYNIVGRSGGIADGLGARTRSIATTSGNRHVSGANITITRNTFVDIDRILSIAANASGHTFTNNVIYGVRGTGSSGWGEQSYVVRDLATGFVEPENDAISPLAQTVSNNNCFITPNANFRVLARRYNNGVTNIVQHYNLTQARAVFGWDTASQVIVSTDKTVIFQDPTTNDYRLLTSGAIAACAGMGAFATAPPLAVCGDGTVQGGEQCDAGVSNGVCPASCSPTCSINTCTPPSTPYIEYFFEPFESQANFPLPNFPGQNWYDYADARTLTAAQSIPGSTQSLEWHWTPGMVTPPGGTMRRLFNSSETLYLGYWVKHTPNWVGSNLPYHPHMFLFVNDREGAWVGPAFTRSTLYIEHTQGRLYLGAQDGANIDQSQIGQNLIGITEERSAHGCNGNMEAGITYSCYNNGGTYWNGKFLPSSVVTFADTQGTYYKGDWQFVETYFQMNTVTNGIGNADGVMQAWVDGELVTNRTDILFRTGEYPDLAFNQFFMGPYIGVGSPVDQTMWIDNLTVANRRPGMQSLVRRVGDLNGDGVVDLQDVIRIIENFRRRQSYDAGADINNDGVVNIFDMVLLGRNWG